MLLLVVLLFVKSGPYRDILSSVAVVVPEEEEPEKIIGFIAMKLIVISIMGNRAFPLI